MHLKVTFPSNYCLSVAQHLTLASCISLHIYGLLDKHKEVHVFCGLILRATAAVRVLPHLLGTVSGLIGHSWHHEH